MSTAYLVPDWPAPPMVRAVTTTRVGGASRAPFDSFNLGDHVGDDASRVATNRHRLREMLALPGEPHWLRQVHGTRVIDAAESRIQAEADGSYATRTGIICAVLTADCLPVFLCDRAATRVALMHAGWRGLAAGILEQGVAALTTGGEELIAYLGPAIGPRAFEVGSEVRDAFVANDAAAREAFIPNQGGRWLADLYALARLRLHASGVRAVYGGEFCTFSDRERFFSYRRDGQCGRMASLIWLAPR